MRAVARVVVVLVSLAAAERASAQQSAPVVVAARDLPRGAVLERSDLRYPAGAVPDSAAPPLGWVTRRVIGAGEPLREPAVAAPEWVRNGTPVQLLWKSGAVELRLTGRAMGSGARGERVWVRVDARRRFAGIVEGPGVVRMETPEKTR